MKTATINGKKTELTLKCDSGMYTTAEYCGKRFNKGMSCNVYDTSEGNHKVLVLSSTTSEVKKSVTLITSERYSVLADLYDPYHGGAYHTALLEECGATNLLKLR